MTTTFDPKRISIRSSASFRSTELGVPD